MQNLTPMYGRVQAFLFNRREYCGVGRRSRVAGYQNAGVMLADVFVHFPRV